MLHSTGSHEQSNCSTTLSHMVTGTMLFRDKQKSVQRVMTGSQITKKTSYSSPLVRYSLCNLPELEFFVHWSILKYVLHELRIFLVFFIFFVLGRDIKHFSSIIAPLYHIFDLFHP